MADLCRNRTFYELFFVTLHAMRVGLKTMYVGLKP